MVGGSGSDTLLGADGNDTLLGNGGYDVLRGEFGNDFLRGGDDGDVLRGGNGADTLYGDAGADALDADDLLFYEYDQLDAVDTVNALYGGAGDDHLTAGMGHDLLSGGADNDYIEALNGGDTMDGGDGNDYLRSSGYADTIYGGAGDDTIEYPSNGCLVDAGDGNDTINLFSATGTTVTGGAGADRFDMRTTYENALGQYGPTVAAPLRITDFNVAEGDTMNLLLYPGYVLWRGAAAPGFTGAIGESLTLAGGDAETNQYTSLWTFYDEAIGRTVLFYDRDRDGLVGADDMRIEFDGQVALDADIVGQGMLITDGFGTLGADTMAGTEGADSLFGFHGNDSIRGLAGNDVIDAGDGNDTIDGGSGGGALYGGAGNDSAVGGSGQDFVYGGGGSDTLRGGGGDDYLIADREQGATTPQDLAGTLNYLYGEDGNDNLIGGAGDDVMDGGTGVDTIEGGDGADRIVYDAQDYWALGGSYNGGDSSTNDTLVLRTAVDVNLENYDVIEGGGLTSGFEHVDASTVTAAVLMAGNMLDNNLVGGTANDTLAGGYGNDVLDGRNGNDSMEGGAGDDTFYVNAAGDIANDDLGGGTDTVYSTIGSTTLSANVENLRILATVNANGTGNALDNTIWAGTGNNVMNGLGGIDTVSYADATAGITASLAFTGAQATGGSRNDTLLNFENLVGSAYGDNLAGNALANVITGNAGNDTIDGGAGDDQLDGGLGNDTLSYATATGGITVVLAHTVAQATGGSGLDTIAGFENLVGSAYNDNLTGSSVANRIEGGAGNDSLNGVGGADTLVGGAGDDTYYIENAGDVVTELAGEGIDLVNSSLAANVLGANVENLRLLSNAAANATGNTLDNVLFAGNGDNVLNGSTGNDTANFQYAATGVTVNLAYTTAQATGGSGTDTLVNIENLTGSANADTLRGNALANRIDGGNQSDWLLGGGGQDTMVGGTGADIFVYSAVGESTVAAMDTIVDFTRFQSDKLDVSRIDANVALEGNQAFTFIGSAAFGADATGQLRYEGGIVYGSVDADADAEFAIALTGTPTLVAGDFLL
jgi:Ca2+-binding RTX toxin-like protein